MNLLLDQMAADSQAINVPKDAQLAEAARLANEQVRLESEVARLEKDLKDKQAELRRVAEIELPELLAKMGLTSFRLTDGSSIEISPDYHCNISEDRRERAHAWLRQHGYQDLIKNQLAIDAGRGDDAKINSLVEHLEGQGIGFERKESVHSSTLKAFVKERVETEAVVEMGRPPEDLFPRELFGVHVRQVAKIKAKKGKK